MTKEARWVGKPHTAEAPLIFIVDDDGLVKGSTGRFVRSLGMRADTFASAQDLLNAERLAEAACLILDVRMPMTSLQSSVAPGTSPSDNWFRPLRDGHNI